MRTAIAILAMLAASGVASAQNPDPSKWMCRNIADSGGFVYQGESVFGTAACRPIPQAAPTPAPVSATGNEAAPRQDAPAAYVTAATPA
ncbi:MAG: hypothetical protein WCC67_18115, partial [Candidatus Acidiferrales bacterium]